MKSAGSISVQSTQSHLKSRVYFPELDILRFLAFFMVYLGHVLNDDLKVNPVLKAIGMNGGFGVPVFFALSAFLITTLLLREREMTRSINLGSFYVRRVLRIWPIYFLSLLVCFFASHLYATHFSGYIHEGLKVCSLKELASYLFFYGNWYSYFHGTLPGGANVLWSVCVEEQFYLVWPLIVKLGGKRAIVGVSIACWIISQFSLHWLLLSGAADRYMLAFNTLPNLQYFAIGGLLGVIFFGRKIHLPTWGRALLIAGGFIAFFGFNTTYASHNTVRCFMMGGVGSALLLVGMFGMQVHRIFNPFRYLGKISYGLYVYHFWLLLFVEYAVRDLVLRTEPTLSIIVAIVTLPLTVLVAHFSYKWYESPFLRLKERFEIVRSRPV